MCINHRKLSGKDTSGQAYRNGSKKGKSCFTYSYSNLNTSIQPALLSNTLIIGLADCLSATKPLSDVRVTAAMAGQETQIWRLPFNWMDAEVK